MDVFVWKSYGEIRVYDVSSFEKCKRVLDDVVSVMIGWGSYCENLESFMNYVRDTSKELETLNQVRGMINYITYSGWWEGAEDFESGTGFYKVI